jgi:membrane-associated PAP2 superfamily phosphatase
MQSPRSNHRDLFWTLAALGLLLAWDAGGLDLLLARPWATSHGFVLRDNWLLSVVLHEGARRAAWVPALWLMVGLWKPIGLLRRLSLAQRLQWTLTTLLALLAISALKHVSHSSCPWDMAEFGGQASWVSHWSFGTFDGGNGHCFPAGHASAGFAFVSGYFVLRNDYPRQARAWLVGALTAGLVLGLAQQLRGAHFMSHTAWTAWLCWTIAWLADSAARALRLRTATVAAPIDAPLEGMS